MTYFETIITTLLLIAGTTVTIAAAWMLIWTVKKVLPEKWRNHIKENLFR